MQIACLRTYLCVAGPQVHITSEDIHLYEVAWTCGPYK